MKKGEASEDPTTPDNLMTCVAGGAGPGVRKDFFGNIFGRLRFVHLDDDMADDQNTADAIATLCAITGVMPPQAADLLQNAGGDVQLAINDFFLQMEGGDGGGPANEAPGDDDDDDDGAMDDEDDDEDDFLDEEGGGDLIGYGGNAAPAPQLAPPPSKRAKVEMRQAPKQASASDELKAQLQRVFALTAVPVDAADKLHRAIDDRVHSWAYGDERSHTYLLNCFSRLGAALPAAAQALANATDMTQMAAAEVRAHPPRPR